MSKSIAQWAKDLVINDNVKIVIQLIPDGNNPNADPTSGWVVWSGYRRFNEQSSSTLLIGQGLLPVTKQSVLNH